MHTYQSHLRPSPWRATVKIAAVAVTLAIIGRCAIMAVEGLPKVLEQGCAVRAATKPPVGALHPKPPIKDQEV